MRDIISELKAYPDILRIEFHKISDDAITPKKLDKNSNLFILYSNRDYIINKDNIDYIDIETGIEITYSASVDILAIIPKHQKFKDKIVKQTEIMFEPGFTGPIEFPASIIFEEALSTDFNKLIRVEAYEPFCFLKISPTQKVDVQGLKL